MERDTVAPSRKQVVTENTNFFLQSRKAPVYSKKQICIKYFPSMGDGLGKLFSDEISTFFMAISFVTP